MNPILPAALGLLSVLASCQTTTQPLRPGMTRTGVAFNYSDLDTPAGDATETNLQVAWGTFMESDQEIGVKASYDDIDVTGGSNTMWTLAVYGRYYLATADVLLPWIELDLGWTDEDTESNASYSAGIGVSQFITQGGAVEASVEYLDGFGDLETAGFRILIGYALFF